MKGFCVSLGKSDGKLMIGGNYGDNSFEVVYRPGGPKPLDREWLNNEKYPDFVATLTGLEAALPGYFDARYNLYHTGINDNFVTGTMNFTGANGQLVLAAQLGSDKADSYHTAVTTINFAENTSIDDALNLVGALGEVEITSMPTEITALSVSGFPTLAEQYVEKYVEQLNEEAFVKSAVFDGDSVDIVFTDKATDAEKAALIAGIENMGSENGLSLEIKPDGYVSKLQFSGESALTPDQIKAQYGSLVENVREPGSSKTDDAIRLRSDNFGIYSHYSQCIYKTDTTPSAPDANTVNNNINAAHKLTVISDLAGRIYTNTVGMRSRYEYKNGDKTATSYTVSNYKISGSGVKADELVLAANFRAEMFSVNNSELFLSTLSDGKTVSYDQYDNEKVKVEPKGKTYYYLDINGNGVKDASEPEVNVTVDKYEITGHYSAEWIYKEYTDGNNTTPYLDANNNDQFDETDYLVYGDEENGYFVDIDRNGVMDEEAGEDIYLDDAKTVWLQIGDKTEEVTIKNLPDNSGRRYADVGDDGTYEAGKDFLVLHGYDDIFKKYVDYVDVDGNEKYELGTDREVGNVRVSYEINWQRLSDKSVGFYADVNGNDTYDAGVDLLVKDACYWDVYERTKTYKEVKPEPDYYEFTSMESGRSNVARGTTIGGGNYANNNEITTHGIYTGKSLTTADNSIWAGNIFVDTSDTYIFAQSDMVGVIPADTLKGFNTTDGTGYHAENNHVGAYGLRSDGSITITNMGSLKDDLGKAQHAQITVYCNDNTIFATYGKKSSTNGSKILAAGIAADTLKLGGVTDQVNIYVEYRNNYINEAKTPTGDVVTTEAYGLKANTMTLNDFDGNIKVNGTNWEVHGIHAGSFVSNTSLGGVIQVYDSYNDADYNAGYDDCNGIGIKATSLSVTGVIDSEIYAGIAITVNSLDIGAFTGEITADRAGFNVTSAAGTVNLAGNITVDGYGYTSLGQVNLRVSGEITADMAIRSEYKLDPYKFTGTVNNVKTADHVELAAGSRVTGDIDLGAGINTLVINSNASLDGVIAAGAGELNITFVLEDPSVNGSAVTVKKYSDDDKTLKDLSTLTIDLNYAKEGKTYNLIQYAPEVGASDKWLNHNRKIAFYFQGESYSLTLENNGTYDEGSVWINDVEVVARFENDCFSVTVNGELPSAHEVKTLGTVDSFAADLVYAAANGISLEWSNLDKYNKARIAAGTLKDVAGNQIVSFTDYQISFVVLDANGNQIGSEITVDKIKNSSYALDLAAIAAENGIAKSDIAAAKLTGVTMNGKSEPVKENGKTVVENLSTTYKFSKIYTTAVEAHSAIILEWENLHVNLKKMIDNGELKDDDTGKNIKDCRYYKVTYQLYRDNGDLLKEFTVNVLDKSDLEINLDEAAADIGCRVSEIAEAKVTGLELVSKDDLKYKVPANADGVVEDVTYSSVQVNDGYAFNLNILHEELQRKIAAGTLQSSDGREVELLTGYKVAYLVNGVGDHTTDVKVDDKGRVSDIRIDGPKGATINIVGIEVIGQVDGEDVTLSYEFPQVTPRGEEAQITLDWNVLADELQTKCNSGILFDVDGEEFAKITGYRISYMLVNDMGECLKVFSTEVQEGKYTVDIQAAANEAGISDSDVWGVKLANITVQGKNADGEAIIKNYSWSDSISMMENFVENYDADKQNLTISWFGISPENYGLIAIQDYELEYTLYDSDGNPIGAPIAVRIDGAKNSYTINGISPNSGVEWRIRMLNGTSVSAWSEMRNATEIIELASPCEFTYDNFSSSVLDANPKPDTTGVIAAIANLSWTPIESTKTIRKYEVEYIMLSEQITLEDVPEGMTLEEYIAGNTDGGLFEKHAAQVHCKTVSGTQLVISNLQNQTYVYWRIKATASNGDNSSYMAGDTFRVWTYDDKDDPVYADKTTGLIDVNYPEFDVLAPDASKPETTFNMMIGWNEATDSDSGVRAYMVEISTDGGKSYQQAAQVNSEDKVPHTLYTWVDNSLNPDGKYKVIAEDGTEFTDVTLKEVDGKKVLSWYAKGDEYVGKKFTVAEEIAPGEWNKEFAKGVDNYKHTTFDYICKLDALANNNYSYRVIAVDYFGNRVDNDKAVNNSIVIDSSAPYFADDDATNADYEYELTADSSQTALLKGDIIWTAASDPESGVRKYVIKFSSNGGASYNESWTQEFTSEELNSSVPEITFTDLDLYAANASIVAGEYYNVYIGGEMITVKAIENNKLRLTGYSQEALAAGDKIKISKTSDESVVYSGDIDNGGIELGIHENKQTVISDTDFKQDSEYKIAFGGEEITVRAENDGEIVVNRDLLFKNITITGNGGKDFFAGQLIDAQLRFRISIGEFENRLPASSYTYQIFAYDYFDQVVKKPLTNTIEADKTAPKFADDNIGISYSGFVKPPVENEAGAKTTYSVVIGWHNADDPAGEGSVVPSGIYRYKLQYTDAGGRTVEVLVDPKTRDSRTFAYWSDDNVALDSSAQYRVKTGDEQFVNAVVKMAGGKVSLMWDCEGDLAGKAVTIQIQDGDSWKDLAVSISGSTVGNDVVNTYKYEFFEYTYKLSELDSALLKYKVTAEDICGNTVSTGEASEKVDSGAPIFRKQDVTVEINEPEEGTDGKISLTPKLTWKPASDRSGDIGIWYYEVKYRQAATADAEAGSWVTTRIEDDGRDGFVFEPSAMDWQVYDYEIVAHDYFGNSTTVAGQFGTPDVKPPTGSFDIDSFAAAIEVDWPIVEVLVPIPTDDEEEGDYGGDYSGDGSSSSGSGNYGESAGGEGENNGESDDGTIKPGYQIVRKRGDLKSAKVTLSWENSFTDPADLIYRVVVSDAATFSEEDGRVYDFYVPVANGAPTASLVFDNDTLGRNVGIFEGMETVYWYVEVFDGYYNKSKMSSETKSFKFVHTDELGEVKITGAKKMSAAPQNVSVKYGFDKENQVRNGIDSVSWTHSDQVLGVYSYTVALKDASGKTVLYSATTLDEKVRGGADVVENIQVNAAANSFAIADLEEFFGEDIAEGTYQLVISAHDTTGRVAESTSVEFIKDTTPPGAVTVSEVLNYNTNQGGESKATMVVRWKPVADASQIDHYELVYALLPEKEGEEVVYSKPVIIAGDKHEFTFAPIATGSSYTYRIVAVDRAGNRGTEWSKDEIITGRKDQLGDGFNNAFDTEDAFVNNRYVVSGESVGGGDPRDVFKVSLEKSASLLLTIDSLTNIIGGSQNLKIEIFRTTDSKALKTFTVKEAGRAFAGLLLDAGDYNFRITSAKDGSIVNYSFTLDKNLLGGDFNDNSDDSFEMTQKVWSVNTEPSFNDWAGFGDAVDVRKLSVAESGKYTFSLSGIAAGTVLSVYEVKNGKNVKLVSVTGSQSKNNVTTKAVLLDKDGTYYVEVKPSSTKLTGSSYFVSVEALETYNDPDTGEGSAVTVGAEDTGWVGFTDEKDIRQLTVGENGAFYTFDISHTANTDEAVKLMVINESGKAVKTVSLAKKNGTASTGSLYLTEGDYKVVVQASGAAKGLNSNYTLEVNGNDITVDMINDKVNDEQTGAESVSGTINGWVGVGDTVDIHKFTVEAGVAYEWLLENINGKDVKAVIGYYVNGKFKALMTQIGAAGSDNLILSRIFTESEIAENPNGKEFYIQIQSNGKTANSLYGLSLMENRDKFGFDPAHNDYDSAANWDISAGHSNWVGLGDDVDYLKLTGFESGFYDLEISGADNPVKLTVFKKVGEKYTSVKSVTVKAGVSGAGISDLLLDGNGEYYAVVNATGARKGQNSDYTLDLVSKMETAAIEVDGDAVSGRVDKTDLYDGCRFEIAAAGIYSFDLGNINGNNLKLSIIDPESGKVLKSFTPAANSTSAQWSYNFTEKGTYIVKLDAAGKAKESDYKLSIISRTADNNDAIGDPNVKTLSSDSAASGWVGQGDAADWYVLDFGKISGLYNLTLSDLENNAQITLYQLTGTGSKKIAAATGKAAAGGLLSGLNLDGNLNYYVAIQASGTNGTNDTGYQVALEKQDDDSTDVSIVGNSNTVGIADASDYYQFTAGTSVTKLVLNIGENKGTVKAVVKNAAGKTVATITADSKNPSFSTDLCLPNGDYSVVVSAGNKDQLVDYTFSVTSWDCISDDNNLIGDAPAWDHNVAPATGSVGKNSDPTDFYCVSIGANDGGNYSLDISGINGKSVKISIGTMNNGKFQSLQSVSGKNGVSEVTLSRFLDGGQDYYIKIDGVTAGQASGYTLNLIRNDARDGFSNADDTWKAVAGNSNAQEYLPDQIIRDWVGFGDAVDVFKIDNLNNGILSFSAHNVETADALTGKDITLSLMDINGKTVALTFDKETGVYNSKNVLLADSEYYLMVKSASPKSENTDYQIKISSIL
ncbi:MAG: fibronectin type III domain-containing protein [Lentisphaeria bacterium]|nr:fibronectin type III domain-containing protein [Lentisphaeria bacterium]